MTAGEIYSPCVPLPLKFSTKENFNRILLRVTGGDHRLLSLGVHYAHYPVRVQNLMGIAASDRKPSRDSSARMPTSNLTSLTGTISTAIMNAAYTTATRDEGQNRGDFAKKHSTPTGSESIALNWGQFNPLNCNDFD
jgi:hypothetical protein